MASRSRLRLPWAVPAVALIGVLGVGAVPHVFSNASSASPDLPVLTPAELLAKARTAQVTGLSGTITLDSWLGLPALSSVPGLALGSAGSLTSLVSGKHSATVAIDGADHLRFATAAPLAETNWIRNGTDLWSYDSASQRTLHFALSGDAQTATLPPQSTTSVPDPAHETPADFAKELLDKVTPSTDVTVAAPPYVAGRAVYELVLAPHAPDSTVHDVTISVDAATGLPLDVQVTARSTGKLALEFGFTDISFDTPAASTFAFTPPPGSSVVEASTITEFLTGGPARHHRDRAPGAAAHPTPPATTAQPDLGPVTVGADWSRVVILPPGTAPSQLSALLANAPSVTIGSSQGRLLSTTLFNVVLLDDGRAAVGAIDAGALEAAVAAAR